MDLSLSGLATAAGETLRDPRTGLRRVLALDPPMQARWIAFLLMAIGSAIVTHLSIGLIPTEERDAVMGVMSSPLRTALLQGVLLLAIVQMVWWLGRLRGGTGSFPDALLAMVWLQFIMLGIQALQLVLMLVSPPLAALANLRHWWFSSGFSRTSWPNFTAFRSLIAVFGGIVFGALLLGFGLALLLVILTGGAVA